MSCSCNRCGNNRSNCGGGCNRGCGCNNNCDCDNNCNQCWKRRIYQEGHRAGFEVGYQEGFMACRNSQIMSREVDGECGCPERRTENNCGCGCR